MTTSRLPEEREERVEIGVEPGQLSRLPDDRIDRSGEDGRPLERVEVPRDGRFERHRDAEPGDALPEDPHEFVRVVRQEIQVDRVCPLLPERGVVEIDAPAEGDRVPEEPEDPGAAV
jgi:hypothetical protein